MILRFLVWVLLKNIKKEYAFLFLLPLSKIKVMKITEAIARHIMEVWEGNWTEVNLKDVLAEINFKEATATVPGFTNTIASLINHLTFYNEVMLQRLNGTAPQIPGANGFDVPEIKNKPGWQMLKQNCYQSFVLLAEAVKKLPEEKLFTPILPTLSETYKSLHGIAEHGHYHTAQIIYLDKWIKYNL